MRSHLLRMLVGFFVLPLLPAATATARNLEMRTAASASNDAGSLNSPRKTDARISINKNDFPGKSSSDQDPGRYLQDVNTKAYGAQLASIDMKRDENVSKPYRLVQQTGGLQFSVEPVVTPVALLRSSGVVKKETGLIIFKAPPVGGYVLRARQSGFKITERPIAITKNQIQTNDLALEKGAAAGEVFTNSLGMEFARIPKGRFRMGVANGERDERPAHRVTISKPFYLGKYEVTQKEWRAVMGTNPSRFEGDNRPVEYVSWNDIQAFIQKLNEKEGGNHYRLPTEAEWEYAAQAGSTKAWSFGNNESQLAGYAWYDANSDSQTHPVGQKKPNAFGLYDLHGNVWEWCQDWYDAGYYRTSPATDPQGPLSGQFRVLRGGSWADFASHARSAFRSNGNPDGRNGDYGFRLLRTP